MPRPTDWFRGEFIPLQVQSQVDVIKYVLLKYRYETPISNGEFSYDLRIARFGGYLHDLRHKDGWTINTIQGKTKGHYLYWLEEHPADENNGQRSLQLIHGGKHE